MLKCGFEGRDGVTNNGSVARGTIIIPVGGYFLGEGGPPSSVEPRQAVRPDDAPHGRGERRIHARHQPVRQHLREEEKKRGGGRGAVAVRKGTD